MKLTWLTRDILRYRRRKRELEANGYRHLELYRNQPDYDEIITDVVIMPDGRSLFWKKEKAPRLGINVDGVPVQEVE